MRPERALIYLLLPAKPAGLIFICIETLGFGLCSLAGLFGLPVLVILLSWLFSYGYVLLEQVAHGAREPPVLALEMVNPLAQIRPLLHLGLVVVVFFSLRFLSPHIGLALTLALGALMFAALPASMAVLAVGDAWWQAVSPLALWRLMRALGSEYLILVTVTVLCGLGLVTLAWFDAVPSWLRQALAIYAWLALYALIGGALYERRDDLGLEAIHSPENRGRAVRQHLERQDERVIDGLFAQLRNGNPAGAWQAIEKDLNEHRHERARYEWLLARFGVLDDQRLASRLAQDYIHRLLNHDNGRVVDIVRDRIARDGGFHPGTAAETLRVAELLRLAGERAGAQRLLADFSNAFADAPPALKAAAQRELQTQRYL